MTESTGPARPRAVWSVGELIVAVAGLVQTRFASCRVRGEISAFSRAASGHCYFTLKDSAQGATLRCAMFRRAAQLAGWQPEEGDEVELGGRLAVYEPRGELQFIVESMQRSGAGALYERFLATKARLEREGLFDVAAKRLLPVFPSSIGVVTSLAGAVLHDVAITLARRSPHVRVVVYASAVQGSSAPASLCEAMATAALRNEVDVLLVCRGGGSLEDLAAFNDEAVVRKIRSMPMPVISGVGHETDFTLVDFAADLRAATPTAAAELVVPATSAASGALDDLALVLKRRLFDAVDRAAQRIDRVALRLAAPGDAVRRRAASLDMLSQRLDSAARRHIEAMRIQLANGSWRVAHALAAARVRQASRLDAAAVRLDAVDPRRVLSRGYALLSHEAGRPVVSISEASPGDRLVATLGDGELGLVVASSTSAGSKRRTSKPR